MVSHSCLVVNLEDEMHFKTFEQKNVLEDANLYKNFANMNILYTMSQCIFWLLEVV